MWKIVDTNEILKRQKKKKMEMKGETKKKKEKEIAIFKRALLHLIEMYTIHVSFHICTVHILLQRRTWNSCRFSIFIFPPCLFVLLFSWLFFLDLPQRTKYTPWILQIRKNYGGVCHTRGRMKGREMTKIEKYCGKNKSENYITLKKER